MPLAQTRSDSEFAFPDRVLGPVQEHRRILSTGPWGEDFFEGRRGGAFMPPPQPLPFQKGGYRRSAQPPARYEDYDYGYDYAYPDEYLAPPPPPPMMRRPIRRPMAGPPMGDPRGMGMQMGVAGGANYFKSVGVGGPPPPAYAEEVRYQRGTPPPPGLAEEMARFRRSPPSPIPGPIVDDMARYRSAVSVTPPMPPGAAVSRRSGVPVRRASGYGVQAASVTPPLPTTALVEERVMAGEVISEEVSSVRAIGVEMWEEQVARPVVTPIMQTVVRQEPPIMVEKRITQETVAPMVVQEQGMAAAATVVESSVAPPTVVQEMGMAAPPTIVQEGWDMGATMAPTMAPTMATMGQAAMMSQWETRPPTVVREADASLPPIAGSDSVGSFQAFQALEPQPIVVHESMMPQMPTMAMAPPVQMMPQNQQPIIVPPQQGYGYAAVNNFEPGMGPIPGGIGAAPMPGNLLPQGNFGGAADLNNLAAPEPKARGLKRLTQKFHRRRQ